MSNNLQENGYFQFASGSWSYFRSVYRGFRYLARVHGLMGEVERVDAITEGSLALSATNEIYQTAIENPYAVNQVAAGVVPIILDAGLRDHIRDKFEYYTGRMATSSVVSIANKPLGTSLAAIATFGEITHAIEQGHDSLSEIVSATLYGEPQKEFQLEPEHVESFKKILDDLETKGIITPDLAERVDEYVDVHTTSSPINQYCFAAGTQVLMAAGNYQAIEKIKVGDKVSAFEGISDELKACKVTRLFQKTDQEIVKIIETDIKVTPGHHFLCADGKYKAIKDIGFGEYLVDSSGNKVPFPGIKYLGEKCTVYNLEVEGLHTYIAGNFRVHNQSLSVYRTSTQLGQIAGVLGAKLASYYVDNNNLAVEMVSQAGAATIGGVLGDYVYYQVDEPANAEPITIDAVWKRFPSELVSTATSMLSNSISQGLNEVLNIDDSLSQLGVSTLTGAATEYYFGEAVLSVVDDPTAVKFFGLEPTFVETIDGVEVIATNPGIFETLKASAPSTLLNYGSSWLFNQTVGRWNVFSEGLNNPGADIGATIGMIAGGHFLGPLIGPAIGNFLGNVLGGWLGDLFGDDDYPRSGYRVALDDGEFVRKSGWELDGGNRGFAKEMADSGANYLNMTIGMTGGEPVSIQKAWYGHYEDKAAYFPDQRAPGWVDGGKRWLRSNPQKAVEIGVLDQLKTVEIKGGNQFAVNVIDRFTEGTYNPDSIGQLLEDIGMSIEYHTYKQNPDLYLQMIENIPDDEARMELERDFNQMQHRAAQLGLDDVHGHSEYIISPEKGTYEEITAYAESIGGHLVTIKNQGDQNFLIETFGGLQEKLWIGLSDEHTEGKFEWINGDTSTFRNFHPNEPNGKGNENFVEMLPNGLWNDNKNSTLRRGIIEIPLHGNFSGELTEKIGTGDKDRLIGDAGNEYILGHRGSDTIDGEGGDDQIHGGRGNDHITPGNGKDVIAGGSGRDVFVIDVYEDGGIDTIVDFQVNDVIKITKTFPVFEEPVAVLPAVQEPNLTVSGGGGITLLEITPAHKHLTPSAHVKLVGNYSKHDFILHENNTITFEQEVINVNDANDAPTVENTIADQTTTEDAAFSFTFGEDTFNDVDAGDTLTYGATLVNGEELPDWLSFDGETRTFTGTPVNENVGSMEIEVTATDMEGDSVSDIFNLTVAKEINDDEEAIATVENDDETDAPTSLVFGTLENDSLEAGIDFDAEGDLVFTGTGEDEIFASLGIGGNRAYSGSDSDELFARTRDRLFGGTGNDILDATLSQGGNRLYGGDGDDDFFNGNDDRLIGGDGSDRFFLGEESGESVVTGGAGADQFWIANAGVPFAANIMTDFTSGEDVLGVAGLGATEIGDLNIFQDGDDVAIALNGDDLAILLNVNSNELTNNEFVFI